MPDKISVDIPDMDSAEFVDRIVEEAARQSLRMLTAAGPDGEQSEVPTELGRRIENNIREDLAEQASAAAPKVAEKILAQGITKHDTYGHSRGEPIPLATFIAQRVETELYDGQTGRKGGGVLAGMIEREVGKQIRAELQGAIDEAKAKVSAAVNAEAANLLTEAMEKALRRIEVSP